MHSMISHMGRIPRRDLRPMGRIVAHGLTRIRRIVAGVLHILPHLRLRRSNRQPSNQNQCPGSILQIHHPDLLDTQLVDTQLVDTQLVGGPSARQTLAASASISSSHKRLPFNTLALPS
jgi:hypothetical protein